VVSIAKRARSLITDMESIGIVAGWGDYPINVAKSLREKGYRVVVAAIRDHASPELSQIADEMQWVGVCKLGRMQRFFQKHNVQQVCLSGKLFKDKILFHGLGWIAHTPDWECIRTFFPIMIWKTRGTDATDDSLLGAVVQSFQRHGMKAVPGTDYATQLIAEAGVLTKNRPSSRIEADLQFGWAMAKQMGGLDIGQSVTVRDRTVLAVEAIEGTDACILRTATVCPRGGFSLVKVAKPQQDMRFDLPTIGPRTIESMKRAGGVAIAIEAGKTILLDRERTIQEAENAGISIVSL
jgi:UDP-2,3-diacylglucosamine hydrolase